MLASLLRHSNRWQEAGFCTDPDGFMYLNGFKGQFSNLKRLLIIRRVHNLIDPIDAFEDPPKLTDVTIQKIVNISRYLQAPWKQLTRFSRTYAESLGMII
jgi:hypothetical protein